MLEHTLPSPNFAHTLGKGALFSVLGGSAAFALFVVMAELASSDDKSFDPISTPYQVTVLSVPDDTDTNVIKPKLPEPPAPPTTPPQRDVIPETMDDTFGTFVPDVGIDIPKIGLPGADMGVPPDGDAMPIVRVAPKYPQKAARDGIEGWVQMSFAIDEMGAVTDVQIVDSEPKRVFDKDAKRALKKWKYKPKVVDGRAVKQFNQNVVLEFNLDQP